MGKVIKEEHIICQRCLEKIDINKPHINLLIQVEKDNGHEITVSRSESLALYHKKCSPFKK